MLDGIKMEDHPLRSGPATLGVLLGELPLASRLRHKRPLGARVCAPAGPAGLLQDAAASPRQPPGAELSHRRLRGAGSAAAVKPSVPPSGGAGRAALPAGCPGAGGARPGSAGGRGSGAGRGAGARRFTALSALRRVGLPAPGRLRGLPAAHLGPVPDAGERVLLA